MSLSYLDFFLEEFLVQTCDANLNKPSWALLVVRRRKAGVRGGNWVVFLFQGRILARESFPAHHAKSGSKHLEVDIEQEKR